MINAENNCAVQTIVQPFFSELFEVNASLLNKSLNFLKEKKSTDPKPLNTSVGGCGL